jgi:hypothetical protein
MTAPSKRHRVYVASETPPYVTAASKPPSDGALIKGMLLRGDDQHRIANYIGDNQGRVNETAKGHRYTDVEPAPPELLPPRHYLRSGRELIRDFHNDLQRMQDMLDHIKEKWGDVTDDD